MLACTFNHCSLTHKHIQRQCWHFTVSSIASLCVFSVHFFHPLRLPLLFSCLSFFWCSIMDWLSFFFLINSGVVLLFFLWLTPLILQLAPVGSFKPQPLFSSALYSSLLFCIAPQNIMSVCDAELHFNKGEMHNQSWPHFALNHNTHASRLCGGWLCWKGFLIFMPFFLSSTSPSHTFGYHLPAATRSFILFHYRLYLSLISFLFPSLSSDISYSSSSACPWGQIGTVVTKKRTVEF